LSIDKLLTLQGRLLNMTKTYAILLLLMV